MEIQPTAKMLLGTAVHNYLLSPAEYKHDNASVVRPLAAALKRTLGNLLPLSKPELAITATFESEGFVLDYKGRIDLLVPKILVIDLKVTDGDIEKTIGFFGYENQLSGYAIAADVPRAAILAINTRTKQTTFREITVRDKWWAYQTKCFGRPK